jgi:uncharacterized protein (UPF0548 family)
MQESRTLPENKPLFRVTRPTDRQLEDILESARGTDPNYEEVGATRDPELRVPGFRHDELACTITAPSAFQRAREGLRTCQVQVGAEADVFPRVFGPDETVIVYLRMGPLFMLVPCRLVYVVDEPECFGFGYGTLPGHPELGEEAFLAERETASSVRFVIRAFSRPADPLAKLVAPVARIIPIRMTKRYQMALRSYVEADQTCS